MSNDNSGGPAWLFSFVDLAFLMLIAMTQLAPDPGSKMPDLGEMIVPHVGEKASTQLSGDAAEVWQLRVHPPEADGVSPYELVRIDGKQHTGEGARIAHDDLVAQLAALKNASGAKPMLAPHEDSRTQDMLEAAAMLEQFWPERRRVAVSRVFDHG